jgi:HNH endonuclease
VSTERDPIFGCALWTGRLDADGYGFHGRSRAHIVTWERANGPVPEGKELDHLCRRRHCVALHHLEAVTRAENERRKSWAYRAKRTRCPRGHTMSLHHQVTPERGIVCRMCNREAGALA